MKINKQLFEDVLSGKLRGRFVLRNGNTYFSTDLHRNYNKFRFTHPYIIGFGSCTPKGIFSIDDTTSGFDIIDFIPDIDMKQNELTIEIPDGKIVDWDESKKQNKIVLKDKQLTYKDVCEKLFKDDHYIIAWGGYVIKCCKTVDNESNATTKHQLECILAKNKLANVAKYLNNGWKPINSTSVWIIEYNCHLGYHAVSIQARSIAFNCYGLVIFKSQELAQQAIEILGEETVKLALEPLGI